MFSCSSILADEVKRKFGGVKEKKDISAIERFQGFWIIGADEAYEYENAEGEDIETRDNYIQLYKVDGAKKLDDPIDMIVAVGRGADRELDLEALAKDEQYLYVLGSHSSKRPKIKNKHSLTENREKLEANKIKPSQTPKSLIRMEINTEGKLVSKDQITLKELIAKDKVLSIYSKIPSKENGVDIEGMACDKGNLYLGFRGPVLRKNFVPVMFLNYQKFFDKKTEETDFKKFYKMLYVDLKGHGIRSMAKIDGGLLILSGPVGDTLGNQMIYRWNGLDMIPDGRKVDGETVVEVAGKLTLLHEIKQLGGVKAEGMTVINEIKIDNVITGYELALVFDNVKKSDGMDFYREVTISNIPLKTE